MLRTPIRTNAAVTPLTAMLLGLFTLTAMQATSGADEILFSGPQAGEVMPSFQVRGVLDNEAGKLLDFVQIADGKSLLLVFVHDANRQSISMTRLLTTYAHQRAKDGLTTGVIFLNEDASQAEQMVQRMKHALTPGVPTCVSVDGREGPGNLGLNRNVMLTVIIAKANKVTANFALVQPSLQVDLPKIATAISEVVGGPAPTLDQLLSGDAAMASMSRDKAGKSPTVDLPSLMRSVINRKATVEQVDAAAKAVDDAAANDDTIAKEVGRIANTIIKNGKLSNYGTPRAQEHLQIWEQKYAAKPSPKESGKEPAAETKP